MNARFYEAFSKVDLINATQAAFNNIKSGVVQTLPLCRNQLPLETWGEIHMAKWELWDWSSITLIS